MGYADARGYLVSLDYPPAIIRAVAPSLFMFCRNVKNDSSLSDIIQSLSAEGGRLRIATACKLYPQGSYSLEGVALDLSIRGATARTERSGSCG